MADDPFDEPEDEAREASWLGSERLRRGQGACLPPTRPPVREPMFSLPAGTPCEVSYITPVAWRGYTTKTPLAFEAFEFHTPPHYTFRHAMLMIRVHESRVKVRKR